MKQKHASTVASAVIIGSLLLIGRGAALAQNPTPVPIFPPPGFVIPPADVPCILPGNKLDLQCFVKNDPDAQRIRAEEAALFAEALAAFQSGTLDPFHQVETLGKLEIFDPNLFVKQQSGLQLLS
jgi:hypothetical protein